MPLRRRPRVEVPQDHWEPLSRRGSLATEAISTCVGVSIYDRSRRHGMLGHFDRWSLRANGTFSAMIEAAREGFGRRPQDARIWVGGGVILDPSVIRISPNQAENAEIVRVTNGETELLRGRVLEAVGDFVAQGAVVETNWLEDSLSTYSYELDVGSGQQAVTLHTPLR